MRYLTLLALCVVVFSCNSSGRGKPVPMKLDTFKRKVLFKVQAPNGRIIGPYLDTVIAQIVTKYVFKDSLKETGGHWQSDSTFYGRVFDDTVRDAQKKPLFDTAHHPILHFGYYVIPKDSMVLTPFH